MPYVLPNDGEVVGVGQPVAVRFDENIPNRLAAQKAITVTTNPPVEGAFYWLNNREVRWRPAQYWKPGTTVDVAVNTYGVDLGDGLFGQENVTTHFTIGDEVIATADDNTKTLTVRRNGEVVKTMPISMGKNSTPTNNGVYIVGDRFSHMVMDSSTYGVPVNSPNGYRTEVDWATQIVLQRHLRALRAVVGRQPGLQQRQPRLPQRQPEQRHLVLRQHQTRRHRRGRQHRGFDAARHRRAGRLEHPVGAVEGGQRQHLTADQSASAAFTPPRSPGQMPVTEGRGQCLCSTMLAIVAERASRSPRRATPSGPGLQPRDDAVQYLTGVDLDSRHPRGAAPAVASGEIEEILGQLLTHREGCVKGREAKMRRDRHSSSTSTR